MAFKKELYDENWKDVIRPAILQRANFKCEICGARQRSLYYVENKNRVYIEDTFVHNWALANGKKVKQIFLAISHSDHNTLNNEASNLKALCQFCHLAHDKEYHRTMRIGRKSGLPRGK